MVHALDASELRRLAVKAQVDPRTIRKLLAGELVRGAAGHRARRALEQDGLLPATRPNHEEVTQS